MPRLIVWLRRQPKMLLQIVLGTVGAAIILLGLNVGLGGIATLGWQVDPDFVAPVDTDVFAVQDSHTRFLGGVWFGVGMLFVAGAVSLRRFATTLIWLCCVIAFAGLFRLSAGNPGVVTDARVIGSFGLELIGFPLLALWLHKTNKRTAE